MKLNIMLLIVYFILLFSHNNCMGQAVADMSVHDFLRDPTITQANLTAVTEVNNGQRGIASAAWWGFDSANATTYLQDAIDSGVAVLVVPKMSSDWHVDPIFLRSDLQIVFENGVVIISRQGSFTGVADALFTMRDCRNVHLKGYGATFQMRRSEYATGSYQTPYAKWRHTLTILGSDNVTVEGLTLKESGGDGIYIGSGSWRRSGYPHYIGFPGFSSNVLIRDVVCESHYRQGIGIVSVDNLTIENCTFSNTVGASPKSGIDFTPNDVSCLLSNIIIRNSLVEGNDGSGINFNFSYLTQTGSDPVSILFDNVTVKNNISKEVYFSSNLTQTTAPDGYIYFSNTCNIDMSDAKIGLPPSGSSTLTLNTAANLQQLQTITPNLDIQFYKQRPMVNYNITFPQQ